jgi:hypothetical protein
MFLLLLNKFVLINNREKIYYIFFKNKIKNKTKNKIKNKIKNEIK